MAERIEIDRGRRFNAKLFFKVHFALADLPYDTFAARHNAVGLKIPAAHNMPFALFYEFFNFLKQCGSISFGVLIQRYLVMAKYVIEIFGKVRRALECG